MHSVFRRYSSLLACVLIASSTPAVAELEHRFSGFATLGIAINDNPDLAFRRDVTQNNGAYENSAYWKNDSLIGVQWQGRWSPEWEAAVQLVAKDRFKNTLENSIEWAFLRYRPVDGLDIRAGRMGADVFMLSDYLQVGYAIPWVRPPHDYYGIASLYHFDGADINKRFLLGDATLNLKAFYGNSSEEYPLGFQSERSTSFDFDVFGSTASLEWSAWKMRYTYARVSVNSDQGRALRNALQQVTPYWPDAAGVIPQLETTGKHFDYDQFGLSYDNNTWWMHSEYVRLASNLGLIADGEHFYASLGRRFDDISVYVITGYAEPKNSVISISPPAGFPEPLASQLNLLANATERSLNGVRIKQKSYGVGTRWDFASKMAIKLQVERFDIDKTGTNLWLRTDPTTSITEDQQATLVSIALDVLF
ncbi:MAG: hypothetical protein AAGC78_14815 [Cellvibrio sp.]|uniref:hypothetical protein n=1 Tax=Cellvibrio sp. TaxID=1965322 RepID=UPI0031AC5A61